jgi:hypothetical protein
VLLTMQVTTLGALTARASLDTPFKEAVEPEALRAFRLMRGEGRDGS